MRFKVVSAAAELDIFAVVQWWDLAEETMLPPKQLTKVSNKGIVREFFHLIMID
jgi:hypothetical protein